LSESFAARLEVVPFPVVLLLAELPRLLVSFAAMTRWVRHSSRTLRRVGCVDCAGKQVPHRAFCAIRNDNLVECGPAGSCVNIYSQFSSGFHREDTSSTVSAQGGKFFRLRGATKWLRVGSAKRESSCACRMIAAEPAATGDSRG
jgi:hypothetical protein